MRTIDVNTDEDEEYNLIVADILDNPEFLKLADYIHHNSNRLQHSLNVSYHSYKISKKLKMDYVEVTRAALLHDFFLVDNYLLGMRSRIKTLFLHPKFAYLNASKYYDLSDKQKNIILSHMFPIGLKLPRYKESILVNLVDDWVGFYEAVYAKERELNAAYSFLFLLIFSYIFRW